MLPKTKERMAALDLQLRRHPDWPRALVAGERNVDQLVRALVPLYLAEHAQTVGGGPVNITSGDVSRFWAAYDVRISAPAVAKQWREHVGYSRRTRQRGVQITPNGVKYVRAAFPVPLDRSGE